MRYHFCDRLAKTATWQTLHGKCHCFGSNFILLWRFCLCCVDFSHFYFLLCFTNPEMDSLRHGKKQNKNRCVFREFPFSFYYYKILLASTSTESALWLLGISVWGNCKPMHIFCWSIFCFHRTKAMTINNECVIMMMSGRLLCFRSIFKLPEQMCNAWHRKRLLPSPDHPFVRVFMIDIICCIR